MSDCKKCGLSPEFHDQYDCEAMANTVHITISRESAEALHRYYPAEDRPHELELDAALRAALETER